MCKNSLDLLPSALCLLCLYHLTIPNLSHFLPLFLLLHQLDPQSNWIYFEYCQFSTRCSWGTLLTEASVSNYWHAFKVKLFIFKYLSSENNFKGKTDYLINIQLHVLVSLEKECRPSCNVAFPSFKNFFKAKFRPGVSIEFFSEVMTVIGQWYWQKIWIRIVHLNLWYKWAILYINYGFIHVQQFKFSVVSKKNIFIIS